MDPKKNKKSTSNFRFSVGGKKGLNIETKVSRTTANTAVLIATTTVVVVGAYAGYKALSKNDASSAAPLLSA